MNLIKLLHIEPCRAASFHARDSLAPEAEAFEQFHVWAEATGLLPKYGLLTLIGLNHPWGPEGRPRGYELLCPLDGLDEFDRGPVPIKQSPGGLFAATTIRGPDRIMQAIEQLHAWVKKHPKYILNYPATYRHGWDPAPEYEIIHTPQPAPPGQTVIDYCVPIRERE